MCFHRPLQKKKIGSVSGKDEKSLPDVRTVDYADDADIERGSSAVEAAVSAALEECRRHACHYN